MKKFTLIFLLVVSSTSAQKFQGKATYKTFNNFTVSASTNGNTNHKQNKAIQEALRKQSQKTFTLNFTQTESNYKLEAELKDPKPVNIDGRMVTFVSDSGSSDVLYKNIKDNSYMDKKEASGKRFLIKDKLPTYEWVMTGETKKIGNYTCYKATKTKTAERVSYSSTDGEAQENKKTVTIETIVWYTPEIPISNGPKMYGGLPGLILEVREGKKSIICSEIVLNPKEKVKIIKPKKGKVVSQEKFDKIQQEKVKELLERFKNNRKTKKGKTQSITIQG